MKSLAATPLLLAALCAPAFAQTTPITPKPVATMPIKPAAPQTPADTAKAMAQTERTAIQSDLAWVGVYNGAINGEVSDRMINAIKAYQKDLNAKQTGVLNPQERTTLAAAARKLQNDVGWKIAQDPINGIRLGVPTKLVPQMSSIGNATGSKWTSAQGQIQIETWRSRDTGLTIAAVAEREKNEPAGRKIDYSVVRPDFFVLSGLQGLKKFYVRGQIRDNEVRGLTILYDQATEGTMAPVVIAMSSAFTPFPAGQRGAGRRTAAAQEGGVCDRHHRQRRRHDHHRPPGRRRLPVHRRAGPRQRRPCRRGQDARPRAAAHLRRARLEADRGRRHRTESRTWC